MSLFEKSVSLPEVDGYSLHWYEMNEGEKGMIRTGSIDTPLELQVLLYDEPPSYTVTWPTELGGQDAANVLRQVTPSLELETFSCTSFNLENPNLTADERGMHLKDGKTIDDVLLLHHTHFMDGEGEDHRLAWARNLEFEPERITGQRFIIFSILSATRPEIADVVKESITPAFINEVDVALSAFDKIYQKYKNGLES